MSERGVKRMGWTRNEIICFGLFSLRNSQREEGESKRSDGLLASEEEKTRLKRNELGKHKRPSLGLRRGKERERGKSRPKRFKVEVSCHVDAMQAPVRRGIFCSCFFVCEWPAKIRGIGIIIIIRQNRQRRRQKLRMQKSITDGLLR